MAVIVVRINENRIAKMNDDAILIAVEVGKGSDFYHKETETSRTTVFCDVSSPKRAQRDSALLHDYVATLTVKMWIDEFAEQKYLEYKGKKYEIKESYEIPATDIVELTCSDARC